MAPDLIYYIAVTKQQIAACLTSLNSLCNWPRPYDLRILSNENFHRAVVRLPEEETRRPREVKARANRYLDFSRHQYATFVDNIPIIPVNTTLLNGKIGADLATFRVERFAAYLSTEERRNHGNTLAYSDRQLSIPCSKLGAAFMKTWNDYMIRLKADRHQLVFTLVSTRHFFNDFTSIHQHGHTPTL